jgi:hypothetical protein
LTTIGRTPNWLSIFYLKNNSLCQPRTIVGKFLGSPGCKLFKTISCLDNQRVHPVPMMIKTKGLAPNDLELPSSFSDYFPRLYAMHWFFCFYILKMFLKN